jgi:hypothetical protein
LSFRRKASHFLALVVVAALAVGLMAGPASAKMSAKHKAQIRKQLSKAVKKNPKVVTTKSFLKKASLVNFKLPVTIRLRESSSDSNPNAANIDLGPSLGQREIDLGGKLAAEIVFHDSYDGGALGNVDINILDSSTKSLTSTSVPLLWNTDVSRAGTSWDSTLLKAGGFSDAQLTALGHDPGCGDVHNANANPATGNLRFALGALNADGTPNPTGTGAGLTGVPIHQTTAAGPVIGFAPAHIASTNPAVDNSIDAVAVSKALTGTDSIDNNHIGGNPQPFPYTAQSTPGGLTQPPSPADTVLRTNALKLTIATPGIEVDQNTTNGVSGGQNMVIGKSGGQANLFGKIPGKSSGIDVTVNLATRINSILRVQDQDAFEPLIAGGNWPAAVFSCGQVWTGGVQNYIPSVHLNGSLKISPAITADGHLRIAKATLASPSAGSGLESAKVALSACLAPYSAYNQETGLNTVPTPGAGNVVDALGTLSPAALPVNSSAVAPQPAANCNAAPTPFVANSALPTNTVQSLGSATAANGYTVTNSGAAVSVAGDLSVENVSADILVGDV